MTKEQSPSVLVGSLRLRTNIAEQVQAAMSDLRCASDYSISARRRLKKLFDGLGETDLDDASGLDDDPKPEDNRCNRVVYYDQSGVRYFWIGDEDPEDESWSTAPHHATQMTQKDAEAVAYCHESTKTPMKIGVLRDGAVVDNAPAPRYIIETSTFPPKQVGWMVVQRRDADAALQHGGEFRAWSSDRDSGFWVTDLKKANIYDDLTKACQVRNNINRHRVQSDIEQGYTTPAVVLGRKEVDDNVHIYKGFPRTKKEPLSPNIKALKEKTSAKVPKSRVRTEYYVISKVTPNQPGFPSAGTTTLYWTGETEKSRKAFGKIQHAWKIFGRSEAEAMRTKLINTMELSPGFVQVVRYKSVKGVNVIKGWAIESRSLRSPKKFVWWDGVARKWVDAPTRNCTFAKKKAARTWLSNVHTRRSGFGPPHVTPVTVDLPPSEPNTPDPTKLFVIQANYRLPPGKAKIWFKSFATLAMQRAKNAFGEWTHDVREATVYRDEGDANVMDDRLQTGKPPKRGYGFPAVVRVSELTVPKGMRTQLLQKVSQTKV